MAENENMVVDQMPPEEQPQESKEKLFSKKSAPGSRNGDANR